MERIFTEEEREIYKDLIEYPEGFIYKCLATYYDDEEMRELLKEKSFLVISKIQSESNKEITSLDIIEAHECDNINEIVQRAYKIEMSKELQNEFIKIYDEQYRSKGKYIKAGKIHYSDSVLMDYKLRTGAIKVKTVFYSEKILPENYIGIKPEFGTQYGADGGGIKPESSETFEKKYRM